MQTDPNWSNFLYNEEQDTIYLLDFGAARSFSAEFTDAYLKLLVAGAQKDTDSCVQWSKYLGFLTGLESEHMTRAHVNAFMLLSRPFQRTSQTLNGKAAGVYDFAEAVDITDKVRSEVPLMLRERLTPPPDESYSLHRKLSGCFLLCTRLQAKVPCADLFERAVLDYRRLE